MHACDIILFKLLYLLGVVYFADDTDAGPPPHQQTFPIFPIAKDNYSDSTSLPTKRSEGFLGQKTCINCRSRLAAFFDNRATRCHLLYCLDHIRGVDQKPHYILFYCCSYPLVSMTVWHSLKSISNTCPKYLDITDFRRQTTSNPTENVQIRFRATHYTILSKNLCRVNKFENRHDSVILNSYSRCTLFVVSCDSDNIKLGLHVKLFLSSKCCRNI